MQGGVIMRAFKIFDEYLDNREIGALLHYENQNSFIIELCENLPEWDIPLFFSVFVKREIYTIPKEFAYLWVKERIPPTGRQNIGLILKNMKLTSYSEVRLLAANNGKSSQDECYIKEIKKEEFPEWVIERQTHNIRECFPITDDRLICLLDDDTVIEVDLSKCVEENQKLSSVIGKKRVLDTLSVDAGGYGISFNNTIFLDATTLRKNGTILPIYASVFYDFIRSSVINTTEACEILECSRQNLAYMIKQKAVTPLKKGWKENVFLKGDITRY